MAPFSLPVILGHLGLPVETFPEDLYDATSSPAGLTGDHHQLETSHHTENKTVSHTESHFVTGRN